MTSPVAPSDVQASGIDDSGYTAIIQSTLALYGLQGLVPQVVAWGKAGASADQINLELQQTPEWKARFAGNTERVANGLAPLDPTTYIGLEDQYRQILNDLPAGFYDSKADIDHFIGANQSPAELSNKVQMADQIMMSGATSGSPELQQAYQQYYGVVGTGGIIASILDPTKAEPLIEQQFTAAQIGGTALQQGLGLTKQSTAMKAAQQGVTLQQAQQAYTAIKGRLATDTAASARFANAGTTPITQDVEEQAGLLGNAQAQRTQRLVGSEEASLFGGHGGASAASNSPGSNF